MMRGHRRLAPLLKLAWARGVCTSATPAAAASAGAGGQAAATHASRRKNKAKSKSRSKPTALPAPATCPVFAGEIAYPNFGFEVLKDAGPGKQRLGRLTCPHGVVDTPNFIFCATKASLKGVPPSVFRDEGTQFILSNTYHLMLQPGEGVVKACGGLQNFTGWRGPMLTDSGGYQIFSLGAGSQGEGEVKGRRRTSDRDGWKQTLIRIDEEGATFRSYLDGAVHVLTPERSIQVQTDLGADFIVVLDECTPFNVDKAYTEASMHRSHRWALRSLAEFDRSASGAQAVYGIIQGGVHLDLRDKSIEFANKNPFFGIAIGGSLGADKQTMHDIVAYTRARIECDAPARPVHLLGIGGVRDIFNGVRYGIDTFDCVHPTRLGRHGSALVRASFWHEPELPEAPETRPTTPGARKNNRKQAQMKIKEHVSLLNSRMRADTRPIDQECKCYTCTNFSRAYLNHLIKAKESLGGTLVTVHNIHFMNRLMADIR